MIQIFFYSPAGFAPLKTIRNLLHGSHGWNIDGAVYGVATPSEGVHPHRIVDALEAAGVHVLPSVHDHTAVPPEVAEALARYGVLSTDTAHDCAKKMHVACGMPHLRPHKY